MLWIKWEYMTSRYPIDNNERDLTQLKIDLDCFGARGWELVSIVVADGLNYRCIFKRPVILDHRGDWRKHPEAK